MTAGRLDRLAGSAHVKGRVWFPAGAVIAGWAKRARSPSGRLARRILGRVDWRRYRAIVVPDVVTMLFASDLALHLPRSGAARNARIAAGLGESAPGPCSAVLNFVTATINRFFDWISELRTDDRAIRGLFGSGFLGGLIKGVGDVLATGVNAVVGGARWIILGGVRVSIRAVTNALAGVAGAVSVAGAVANTLAPWAGQVVAAPNPTARGVGAGVPGLFILNVTAPLSERRWAPWLVNCAGVFDLPLPSLTPQGADVSWDVSAQSPLGLIPREGDTGPLDDQGRAQLAFQTTTETPDEAKGEPATGVVSAVATVHRTDLDRLRDRLSQTLFSALPGVLRDLAGRQLEAIVRPMIDSVTKKVEAFRDVDVTGRLAVGYHRPREPDTSRPTALTWNGTWRSGVYPLAGAFTVRLARDGTHLSGAIRIGGSRCVSGGAVTGSIVNGHIRFGTVTAEAAIAFTGRVSDTMMAGTWAASGCGRDSGTWHATQAPAGASRP